MEKQDASVMKIVKYELMYIKLSWVYISLAVAYTIYNDLITNTYSKTFNQILSDILFYIIVFLMNFAKRGFVKHGFFSRNVFYFLVRTIELFAFVIAMTFSDSFNDINQWAVILIVFPILITTLCKGSKIGLLLLGFSFSIHIFVSTVKWAFGIEAGYGLGWNNFLHRIFIIILYHIILCLFTLLCGMIYKDSSKNESENKKLLEQLGEKYEQLAVAQDEIKVHYDKIKDTNVILKDTNKRLTSSIAEFYTLQQITQAIGSILDIKELLKYVNDIILGVMGVNYSTIILFDEKRAKLKVHTTNLKIRNELITLNDNINCTKLLDVLNNGKAIIENFVDPDEYIFTEGREVNSLICVPLNTKSRKFGLVLIEHKYYSAFDEENVRLLDIIGQQVGIAMENAELYQKMQELATIDYLTEVYNRLYFQERLQKEFKNAQEENYTLSLAIFDIDHFKRFNDTFGHLFGDKVLKIIAELVKKSLRNNDILARYGGEEFIILFPRTSLNEAFEKVELLRQKIAQLNIKDNLVSASVTVSFGISCFPDNAVMESELIRFADDALYEAKSSGRNCVKTA